MARFLNYPPNEKVIKVNIISFPKPAKRKKIETKRQRESAEAEQEQYKICESIKTFIELTRWQEADEDEMGTSWLELMVRYYQVGGYLGRKRSETDTYVKAECLKGLLPKFKKYFKKVVDRCVDEDDQSLFKSCRVLGQRLIQLGVLGNTAGINCKPCWPKRTGEKVAAAIISTVCSMTKGRTI